MEVVVSLPLYTFLFISFHWFVSFGKLQRTRNNKWKWLVTAFKETYSTFDRALTLTLEIPPELDLEVEVKTRNNKWKWLVTAFEVIPFDLFDFDLSEP